ncbi:IucA/IucC family protein [Salimicrobium salexigens]|uniref:Siderophore synthetase component n=1 Tax=Salimicrobium salexigens TaxID=908941 RepID=A0ABY1KY14_9BACI|nr:IucA/IucC family protein [Salimicrobium salexigens]SIS90965.1 Siderophore synthetase component [Salimicrobium salexigens]
MNTSYEQQAENYIFRLLLQSIIRENLVSFNKTPQGLEIEVPKGGRVEVPVSRTYILGHIDIGGSPVYVDLSGKRQELQRMEELLMLLGFRNESFVKEMMNSALNYASALEAFDKRKEDVPTHQDTWDYIVRRRGEDPDFSPLVFFEQWVIDGHTTHPGTRTRLPMSPEDVRKYAPEWGASPGLVPLAVRDDKVGETAPFHTTMTGALTEASAEVKKEFEALSGSYRLIPLHPWQADHTLPVYYKKELEDGTMIPLASRLPSYALMSFRTMALAGYGAPHLKTAMNVQMTSAVRTVSAASTRNAPVMAGLLTEIAGKDADIGETTTFSRDLAGIYYAPGDDGDRNFFEKNAASILRENPEASLKKGEIAMPAAAFISASPVTGSLLIEELAGETTEEAFISFLETYARVLLPGVTRLMSEYGIAMEAHLQNTVVILKDRRPVRIDIRDCGGVRILPERLNRHFKEAPIDPSTKLLTDKEEDLTDIFSHALFHNHLGEIIMILARRHALPESGMWETVRRVFRESMDAVGTAEAERDQERLMTRPARMKSLVRMRLSGQFTDYEFVDTPNPFQEGGNPV